MDSRNSRALNKFRKPIKRTSITNQLPLLLTEKPDERFSAFTNIEILKSLYYYKKFYHDFARIPAGHVTSGRSIAHNVLAKRRLPLTAFSIISEPGFLNQQVFATVSGKCAF